MENTLFYIVATLAVIAALTVISNKNPVYSALSLVGFLFVQAILFVLLKAYFLATIQILIYAGAIMVLFIYVVMVMRLSGEALPKIRFRPFSIFCDGLFGAILIYIFLKNPFTHSTILMPLNDMGEIRTIGKLLFTDYVLPFEVISLLLIVAMVGAVVLNRKEKSE